MSLLALAPSRPAALHRVGAGLIAGSLLAWSTVVDAAPMPESFSGLVKQVTPAVVISASPRTETARPMPQLPFRVPEGSPFEEFFKRFGAPHGDAQPRSREMTAAGSGFIIDPSGYVVTNNHVVNEADEVRVRLTDDTSYVAQVIGTDPATDLALLKIEADRPLPFVRLGDSDRAEVGDWVVAVGNPFGLGGSVTAGIISARGRNINAGPYDDFLQIDASINRGNSGGPLFNVDGDVIGVNTAIFSPTGGNIGIGFAIPSNMAKSVIAQLREDGRVERGWLGVRIQGVTADIANALGLDEAKGALVTEVNPDSPAARAGLRQGDVIRQFDGKPVEDGRALARIVGETPVNETAAMDVWRDGAALTLSVVTGEQPGSMRVAGRGESRPESSVTSEALGAELATLTPAHRQRLGIDDSVEGVLVLDVKADGAAQGLRQGDVIKRVGEQPVTTPQAVEQAVGEARERGRKSVLMLVSRGGHDVFLGMKLPVA